MNKTAFATLILPTFLTACAGPTASRHEPHGGAPPMSATIQPSPSASSPSAATSSTNDDVEAPVAKANNAFGLSLYERLGRAAS